MICINCGKRAKKSYTYPGMFVCGCTGILEDIEVIKQTLLPEQLPHFGYVKFVPKNVDILGTIESLAGDIFYFELIKPAAFSPGTLVKFNKGELQCEQSKIKYPLAINLISIADN